MFSSSPVHSGIISLRVYVRPRHLATPSSPTLANIIGKIQYHPARSGRIFKVRFARERRLKMRAIVALAGSWSINKTIKHACGFARVCVCVRARLPVLCVIFSGFPRTLAHIRYTKEYINSTQRTHIAISCHHLTHYGAYMRVCVFVCVYGEFLNICGT